eukprot:3786925-Rhodomonas_salina.2
MVAAHFGHVKCINALLEVPYRTSQSVGKGLGGLAKRTDRLSSFGKEAEAVEGKELGSSTSGMSEYGALKLFWRSKRHGQGPRTKGRGSGVEGRGSRVRVEGRLVQGTGFRVES